MASPNNPASSKQLILKYSQARYIAVNSSRGGSSRVDNDAVGGRLIADDARQLLAKKYR